MAGPGIRIWELARALSNENQITISVPKVSDLDAGNIKVSPRSLFGLFRELIANDIVIAPIYSLDLFWLLLAKLLGKRIVIDAYFIPLFENIEKYTSPEKEMVVRPSSLRTKFLLMIGDCILCASERQKEYWQKLLASFSMQKKIDLLPTGIPDRKPVKTKTIIKGAVPGINEDDKVILWASGIWPWLDPITAIKTMKLIDDEKVKLVFFGIEPVDEHFRGEGAGAVENAIKLAGKRVFFVKERVPYDEISNYLLEADVAVNLHHDHLETRYAYRTRLLDYIWAGIPVVTTRGDVLSEIIAREKMGIVVDYEDDKQVAEAILKLLRDKELYALFHENMQRYAAGITWQKVASPLRDYCRLKAESGAKTGLTGLLITLASFYFWSFAYLFKKLVLRAYS